MAARPKLESNIQNGFTSRINVLKALCIEKKKDEQPNPKLESFAYLRRQVSSGQALQGKGCIILRNGKN